MKITFQDHVIYVSRNSKSEYPMTSILLAVMLLYMVPFTSRWMALVSFAVCLYRVVRYDAKVFATDYCILLPLASLTNAPGTPALLIYLCLLAGIWYFIKGGLQAKTSVVILIVLLNYMLTRMQMDINAFVLCFGQLFVLCMLLPKQDELSVERTVKAFITSLIISSAYAFVLRNTYQIQAISGEVSYAIWGTSILRFKGLFADPNYYMTLLIIGLALLIKLKECRLVGMGQFIVQGLALAAFGILTYSKTFFLVFVLLGGVYVIWQFWSRKLVSGMTLGILAVAAAVVILSAENSPFEVVMERLLSARNLSDLTTGRTEVYLYYLKAICEDVQSFFFGKGMAAKALFKDPHNIYLEFIYYIGTVGFGLAAALYFSLVRETKMRSVNMKEQHFIARYVVLFMFLLLYFSLHGMFQVIAYGELFLAILSLLITKKPDELPGMDLAAGKEMAL